MLNYVGYRVFPFLQCVLCVDTRVPSVVIGNPHNVVTFSLLLEIEECKSFYKIILDYCKKSPRKSIISK